MIAVEYLNNGTLIKHYSDKGVAIEQVETGDRYGEAVDIVPCPYTYIETDEKIETEEESEEEPDISEIEEKAMAYDILTGVIE